MADGFTYESLSAVLGQRPFRFYPLVGSTQDLARTWALADPRVPAGAVIIAEMQTAGRGRQGRPWHSPAGSSIMTSVIVRPALPAGQLPRLTAAAGIAVAETISTLLPGAVELKWPNDVLVRDRKIAGILTEATWIGERLVAVIIGIGLNVRTDFTGTDLEAQATSLEREAGHELDRHPILVDLLNALDRWMGQAGEPVLMEAWRGWLGTLGRRVTVYPQHGTAEPFQGTAEAVDDSGALLVRLDSGAVERVVAADVGLAQE